MLVGVGGQGTILASKLLTLGLLEHGYDVKMSEIHGMSQRGGSVSSMIRYGEKVACPVIEEGTVDLLIAFEKLEALRYLPCLKQEGTVVANDFRIDPAGVLSQQFEYPANVAESLAHAVSTIVVPASKMAQELGNSRVMNIILLGIIAKFMGLDDIEWKSIIARNVKGSFVEINLAAFERGFAFQ
jgi:indolepyruvate ferredoxin oxidoreductase beta subunit